MRTPLAITLALFSTAACAGKTSPGTASPPAPASGGAAQRQPPARGANRNVIARAEIEQAQGVLNAYDLVNRLRPHFLRVDGRTSIGAVEQTPLVRLNGSVLGDINTLRTIDVTGLEEIRYYSIVEAESRWSGDRGRPVIALTSRKLTGK